MSSGYLYYALWLLAHTLVALITQTRDAYHRLIRGVLSYLNPCNNTKFVSSELTPLRNQLPEHITVLLPSTPTYYKLDVLVNLTLWTLASNITYLSFYDPLGMLEEKEEELIQRIQSKLDARQSLIWYQTNNPRKNGFQDPKIHVKIHTQGRQALVETCKHLARTEQEISVPIISKHQQSSYEFPDPQLAIYFGEYLNLCGYPPWQVRLTEFLHGGHMQSFDARQFVAILKRYTKCEQRVGK